jgi:hypothetical protein
LKEESASFLKKRSKKLLILMGWGRLMGALTFAEWLALAVSGGARRHPGLP